MTSLRCLGEIDLVSVRGVGVGGRVDHGVGQDAVSEVLEGLILLLGVAISVLITLRNFTTSSQPSLPSDICEARSVLSRVHRLLGSKDM